MNKQRKREAEGVVLVLCVASIFAWVTVFVYNQDVEMLRKYFRHWGTFWVGLVTSWAIGIALKRRNLTQYKSRNDKSIKRWEKQSKERMKLIRQENKMFGNDSK